MSEKKVWKIKDAVIGKGIPKIIIPLVGDTKENILQEAKFAKTLKPDAVEWRVDAFQQADDLPAVQEVIAQLHNLFINIPLLVTFRSKSEGGHEAIKKGDYVNLNKAIIETHQADLIDVELFMGHPYVEDIIKFAKANHVYTVMSSHDFEKTPPKEEIVDRLRKMQHLDADIPKVAVMPREKKDVLTLLEATVEMHDQYADRPIITMSMGGIGMLSRISGEIFGSSMTFGSGKQASAPGQIPVAELRKALSIVHNSL